MEATLYSGYFVRGYFLWRLLCNVRGYFVWRLLCIVATLLEATLYEGYFVQRLLATLYRATL